jgi:NitT/TauT family transport system substrate-binding protein
LIRVHRRAATIGVLALCLLAACGQAQQAAPAPGATAPAPAPAPTEVGVVTTGASISYLPFYVAESQGFFKKRGLSLKVTNTSGGGPDVQALLAHDADFDLTATSFAVLASQEGHPILIVENLLGRSQMELVMRNDVLTRLGLTPTSPLDAKLKALKGLTIGVTGPGSLGDQVMRFLIGHAGLQVGTDVKIAGVSNGAAMVAALENHQVDGYMNGVLDADRAVDAKVGTILISNVHGDVPAMREYEQEGVLVRPDYVQQHPDTVRSFVAALVEAQKWMSQHSPQEIEAAAQSDLKGVKADTLTRVIADGREDYPPDGKSTQAGIEAVEKVMLLSGRLKQLIPWDKLATNAYLPAS